MSEIDLNKLAALAQLSLAGDPAAKEAAHKDLEAIIKMIDSFADAEVGDTRPMSHPLDLTTRLRPDEATAEIRREVYQALAPQAQGGHYLVPQVLETD